MKASELRIGNYIGILDPGIYKKCDLLDIKDILDGDTTYKPIPLTPEWLVRAGFTQKDMADLGLYCSLKISDEIKLSMLADSIWIDEHPTPAIYVHQLQNLYFALTGLELNISNEQET